MSETTVIIETCLECGVEVRDGTQFCYNCGKPVTKDALSEVGSESGSYSSIDDTANLAAADKAAKRASAALERKRSRISSKRETKIVWEEPGPNANKVYLLVCILLFAVAAAVVVLTVFAK